MSSFRELGLGLLTNFLSQTCGRRFGFGEVAGGFLRSVLGSVRGMTSGSRHGVNGSRDGAGVGCVGLLFLVVGIECVHA